MRQISSFKQFLVTSVVSILLAYPPLVYAQSASLFTRQPPSETQILNLAQQVSVRILSNGDAGSGVIIHRQGNQYTIVTNAHVVEANSENRYTILTADGKTYQGAWQKIDRTSIQDIALLQFQSSSSYPVAQFRDLRDLQTGEFVYSAGFPNWHWIGVANLEETQDWGFRAFQLTVGQVGMLLPQPLTRGYQLGYTNDVDPGMSGGAILDQQGRLVGINGGLKYPLQGISAFTFADGTLPSNQLFQTMNALSWAIPVSTIQSFLELRQFSL